MAKKLSKAQQETWDLLKRKKGPVNINIEFERIADYGRRDIELTQKLFELFYDQKTK